MHNVLESGHVARVQHGDDSSQSHAPGNVPPAERAGDTQQQHGDALDIEASLFGRKITPRCDEMRAAIEAVS